MKLKDMKLKEIQELIDFIDQSGLEEVSIELESFKLTVKKHGTAVIHTQLLNSTNPSQNIQQTIPQNTTSQSSNQNQQQTSDTTSSKSGAEGNYVTIKSPMIGTFYRSANPDSPVFVNVGDVIEKGKVVCIIEAMKLFNEIESEFSGKIVKILVDNASPVEYDQPLFIIEPIG